MRISTFKVTALVVVLLIVGTVSSAEDELVVKDKLIFGDCFVSTHVDGSSGEILGHTASCDDGVDIVALFCQGKGHYSVVLGSDNASLPVNEQVDYSYRFGRGVITVGKSLALGAYNISLLGEKVFFEMAEGISSSLGMVFKLAGHTSDITFTNPDARYVIDNLLPRCHILQRDSEEQ